MTSTSTTRHTPSHRSVTRFPTHLQGLYQRYQTYSVTQIGHKISQLTTANLKSQSVCNMMS
ncbi:hypothetical protein DPMN_140094 [Dreissena polymorpha]|uniref:Uncharacterized protein n=1 Tax=Dreissena polymorpha TaxID=45954 RepID=A0A9D4GCW1_DREPO|nr:hypothetical protein DPMN_140094 [Dreissena polymorpha]